MGRRIAAVVNPVSGGGAASGRRRVLEDVCATVGCTLEVFETASPSGVAAAAGEAIRRGPDVLVLVGGDGSVGELCRAYDDLPQEARPPVVLLPAGRGNSLYKALFADAPWEEYLRRAVRSGTVRGIDAARIEETQDVWVLGFSCGYFHDTVAATRYFRGLRGRALYAAAGIFATTRLRPFDVEVAVDGRAVYAGPTVLVGCAGGPFRGGRLHFYPTSDLTDGVTDVVIVEDMPSRRFTEVLRAAGNGEHLDRPDVHAFQGGELRISSSETWRCELDGTLYPYEGSTLTIRCLPALLPVVVPDPDWTDLPDAGPSSGARGRS